MGNIRTHNPDQPNYRQPVRGKIMAAFLKRPGQLLWLSEVMDASGETNARRVQSALSAMARDGSYGITVHTRGQAWTYRPAGQTPTPTTPPAPPRARDGRMFEAIGPAKDGSLIIESETGTLWRAIEL